MGFTASPSGREADDKSADKPSWPLWKRLALLGIFLIISIPLGVGLGVGLSKNKNGGNNEHRNEDNSSDAKPRGNYSTHTSIWQPEVGASWQIILVKPIQLDNDTKLIPGVDIYDLDLYDNDKSTFTELNKRNKRVICYFSAGSWENWRSDKGDFDQADLGKELDDWPGERWLNVSSQSVRGIMKKRIELAAQKGCDAIDPDNVDGFQNDNGLGLTRESAINYVEFLADTAASLNMSTGLKNAGDIIHDVISKVHFSVNEECVQYSECQKFATFINNGKPVFHIEYPKGAPGGISAETVGNICSGEGKSKGAERFSTVMKATKLGDWVEYCDGRTYV